MQLLLIVTIILGVFGTRFAAALNVKLIPYQSEADADSRKLEIINGVPAQSGQFPFHAGLQFPHPTPGYFSFCGGALITNGTVLTAAHCVESTSAANASRINVTLNTLDFFGSTPGAIKVSASGFLMHPGYIGQSDVFANDVALIYLRTPVTTIAPVRLPCATSVYDGATAQIAGYGRTASGANSLSQLMTTNLTVLTNAACNQLQGSITNLKICAASVGTDICFGDSGGSLTVNGVSIGITSYTYNNCNNYPTYSSVFARVSSFRSWIDANKRYL